IVAARPMLRGAVDLFANRTDLDALRHWITSHRLEVLIVDALSRAHTANESDAQEFGHVLAALDALRHESGCAIELLHHERKELGGGKGKSDDLDALRGTSRLQSDPTLLIRLKQSVDGLRCVVFAKVSGDRTPEPIYYAISDTGRTEIREPPEARGDANREHVLQAGLTIGRPFDWTELPRIP